MVHSILLGNGEGLAVNHNDWLADLPIIIINSDFALPLTDSSEALASLFRNIGQTGIQQKKNPSLTVVAISNSLTTIVQNSNQAFVATRSSPRITEPVKQKAESHGFADILLGASIVSKRWQARTNEDSHYMPW